LYLAEILDPEPCHDSFGLRSIRNVNKHPGSLWEVFEVSHSQLHTLPELPKFTDQTLEDSFAQVIQSIPCANLECKNCGGASSKGFTSTTVKSLAWIISACV
jgi:hypothetical protein